MSSLAILPSFHVRAFYQPIGHFYFGQIGHYHFGITGMEKFSSIKGNKKNREWILLTSFGISGTLIRLVNLVSFAYPQIKDGDNGNF
jgi:hypothetical protein